MGCACILVYILVLAGLLSKFVPWLHNFFLIKCPLFFPENFALSW